MSPQGGGPTRRSHTKSRKGCKTCKKRHIRCDETFPQCRNCTKHSVRCDYMDAQPASEAAELIGQPDLCITPKIENDIRQWKQTGILPFSGMEYITVQSSLAQYSETDLRLIHHILSITDEMQRAEKGDYAHWLKRIPIFINLAFDYDYVMHSMLALSASHLGWITQNPATLNLSYHHRVLALNGLHRAIDHFSIQNSDAILAASITLSWQASEWDEWKSLMQGTQTVIANMQAWKDNSQFKEFIEEAENYPVSQPVRQQNPEQDANNLNYIFNALRKLEPHVRDLSRQDAAKGLGDLINFIRNLFARLPIESVEDQFEMLQPLRNWLIFLPIQFMHNVLGDSERLILLAYFYGVSLAVEPLFPAIGPAYFGSMAVGPIREIHKILLRGPQSDRAPMQWPITLMEFPLEMVREFRIRMGWIRADEVQTIGDTVSPMMAGMEGSDTVGAMEFEIEPLSSEEFYQEMLWRG